MDLALNLVAVPTITAHVFGAMQGYKIIIGNHEKYVRFTPIIAVALGCILGIVCFYAAKQLMPADNIVTAILTGGVSGLAATGAHQIYKQFARTSISKNTAVDTVQNPDEDVSVIVENTTEKTDESSDGTNA